MTICFNKTNNMYTVTVFLLIILLLGCTDKKVDTPASPEIIQDNYTAELQSLLSKAQHFNDLDKPTSVNFNLNVSIDENKDKDGILYLIYEVTLDKPKINMDDVKISFILNPSLMHKLSTTSIFHTTIEDPRTVNMDPVNIHIYSNALATPLKGALLDKTFLQDYKDVLVKVSWKSQDGKDHIIFYPKKGIPSSGLIAYLESNKT